MQSFCGRACPTAIALLLLAGSLGAQPWLLGEAGEDFGLQLATGDLDGDGTPDLAVAGPRFHVRGVSTNAGRVVVIRSGRGELETRRGEWVPETGNCRLGHALAIADLDGDRAWDLLLGSPSHEGARGAVYAIAGGKSGGAAHGGVLPKGASLLALVGPEPRGGLGSSLAVGDLDGDGRPDLALGEPGAGPGGRVWVLRGRASWAGLAMDPSSGPGAEELRVLGAAGAGVGQGLAIADLDGDGLADLVVAAPLTARAGTPASGSVYVLRGRREGFFGRSLDLAADDANHRLDGSAGGRLGAALAAKDLDGDGVAELLLGEPGRSAPRARGAGAVHAVSLKGAAPRLDLALAEVAGVSTRAGAVDSEALGVAIWVGSAGGARDPDLVIGAGAGRVLYLEDPSDIRMPETRAHVAPGDARGFGAAVAALARGDGGQAILLVGAPGRSAVYRYER
jgi:hypothetical protein